MQRIIFFVFTLLLAAIGAHTPIAAQGIDDDIDLDALYEQIDEALENSPRYVAEREKKIEEVRNTFFSEQNLEKRQQAAADLFNLYQPYKNDSALYYAEMAVNLADSIRRPDLAGLYRSLEANLCSGADMFTEALEQLRLTDKRALTTEGLTAYYTAWMHVCGQIGSYSDISHVRQRYYDMQDHYRDSVLMVADKNSENYLHLKMDILNARQLYQDALALSKTWLSTVSEDTHEGAFAAFYRSMVFDKLRNEEMTCYWLGKSALADIRNAVMNQAALVFLADHLANNGDFSRAKRYTDFATKCNFTFSPRLRTYQVNSVINVLSKSQQAEQKRANMILTIAGIVIVFLLIALAYTTILSIKRKKK